VFGVLFYYNRFALAAADGQKMKSVFSACSRLYREFEKFGQIFFWSSCSSPQNFSPTVDTKHCTRIPMHFTPHVLAFVGEFMLFFSLLLDDVTREHSLLPHIQFGVPTT
jgi:hypothetical protein